MRLRADGPSGSPGAAGPDADVVVSSRIRLARNLAGVPFVTRASDPQRSEVVESVRRASKSALPDGAMEWLPMEKASTHRRQLLVEQHLISKNFAEVDFPRAVALGCEGELSVMVNEEDHLRIQALRPGLDLERAMTEAHRFDEALGQTLDYAFSPRWGYLTACPTNVGCGIRVSVMVHLPSLKLTGELERVKRAAKDLNLAVRGFYGEGTDAIGSFFQISNQVTLGVREEDLLEEFAQRIVPQIVAYEREARAMLLERSRLVAEDKVHRAAATLQAARLLTADESLKLLSSLRLGVAAGLVGGLPLDRLSMLLVQTQPAHLVASEPAAHDEQAAKAIRASLLRQALRDITLH
ncbi:MAG: ATP--guanido phosphotransferase [Phycisphaeraceae bacterium]|nr:ATP--guanido phosphotransferase [Phycisphaeraceae bacterium]